MSDWGTALIQWGYQALLRLQMKFIERFYWKPFIRNTRDPQQIQNKVIEKILARQQSTEFGIEHDFKTIQGHPELCKRVPVQTYESLRKYIDDQENNKTPAINYENPVLYSQTSGTTGRPKNIPILKSTLNYLKLNQALFSWVKYNGVKGVFDGPILAVGSPVIEGQLGTGTPFGSMSGLLLESMPWLLKKKYVLPTEILAIEDYHLKYLLMAAYSLNEKNITFFASANPSTFLRLLEVIQNNKKTLLSFLDTGDLNHLGKSSEALSQNYLKVKPNRAQELTKILQEKISFTFADFWPHLKAIATWTGGNCTTLIPKLKSKLPSHTRIVELGYLSSEFTGGLTIDVEHNIILPTFQENFFEFVEVLEWDKPDKKFLLLNQIETGKQYYLIVTTFNGLYRYFINDIIEVTGKFNATPTITFVQKGKGITNLTGEKLSEYQVIRALETLKKQTHLEFEFFLMIADASRMEYRLYIESDPLKEIELKFEEQLFASNLEFKTKRLSQRLNPTKIIFLKKGCGEAFKNSLIAKGQRESQFKFVRLLQSRDCSFDFSAYGLNNED